MLSDGLAKFDSLWDWELDEEGYAGFISSVCLRRYSDENNLQMGLWLQGTSVVEQRVWR